LIETADIEVAFLAKFKNSDKEISFPAFLNLGFLNNLNSGTGFEITAAITTKK